MNKTGLEIDFREEFKRVVGLLPYSSHEREEIVNSFNEILDQLINQTIEDCAKLCAENFDEDLYKKYCEDNKGRFHSGQFSEREMVMEFIAETIRDSKE